MSAGITLSNPAPGELIYFNLTDHPGNTIDHAPPSAPANVVWNAARYMGVGGVEVTWEASLDDHWLSYYEIRRDGEKLDHVAKGCFYFDHSAGADPAAKYEICAVDGSGNTSTAASAPAPEQPRRIVVDDSDAARWKFVGSWTRDQSVRPIHGGTLSYASESGATCTLRFTGRAVVSVYPGLRGWLRHATCPGLLSVARFAGCNNFLLRVATPRKACSKQATRIHALAFPPPPKRGGRQDAG